MRRMTPRLMLALAPILTGCMEFALRHPLFTEKNIVFDPALIGVWEEEKDGARVTWAFERSGEKGYRLVYTDEDEMIGEFEVHLLEVEGIRYLDFYPNEEWLDMWLKEGNRNDFYRGHFVAVHSRVKVKQIEPMLAIECMDLEFMVGMNFNGPAAFDRIGESYPLKVCK